MIRTVTLNFPRRGFGTAGVLLVVLRRDSRTKTTGGTQAPWNPTFRDDSRARRSNRLSRRGAWELGE
jgi:hypothetical protein